MRRTISNKKELLVAVPFTILFVLSGAGLFYWATHIYNDINSIRKNGIKTEGTIIRYERRGPSSSTKISDIITVPIVQFRTKSGNSIIVEGNVDDISILQNICQNGEKIEIIYDPDNPSHAVINTFAELWFAPLLMWTIGVAFMIGPPFTIWRYYKSKT